MIAITRLVAHNPAMTVMTMITVLMTTATHQLDVYILNMTVMIITSVPPKHVLEDNVIMNELTVTITMLALMTGVNQTLVVNTKNMIATIKTLVLMMIVPNQLDVYTMK
jgi:hypothetical protein